jgi:hypothetical protein
MLRKRAYLVEEGILSSLPSNTKIADIHGLRFSSWNGKLALVMTDIGYYGTHSDNPWFDSEKIAQRYSVRYAVDFKGNKIPADEMYIGRDPCIANPRIEYEKTTFKIGRPGSGIGGMWGMKETEGTFIKPENFWVKKTLKELSNEQNRSLYSYLGSKPGFSDVSWLRLTVRDWKSLLKMSFAEIQELPSDKANQVDALVTKKIGITSDEVELEKAWREIKGVYAVGKNGSFKFIVRR